MQKYWKNASLNNINIDNHLTNGEIKENKHLSHRYYK